MKHRARHKLLTANLSSTFMIAIGAGALAGCQLGNALPGAAPTEPPVVTPLQDQDKDDADKPAPKAAVAVTVEADKTNYQVDEIVRFTITARNTAETEQLLIFTSGQSFEIRIRENRKDESPLVWNWSHGRVFTRALRRMNLAPGETKTYEATWDQKDNEGATVPRGNYRVEAQLTANGGIHAEPIIIGLID